MYCANIKLNISSLLYARTHAHAHSPTRPRTLSRAHSPAHTRQRTSTRARACMRTQRTYVRTKNSLLKKHLFCREREREENEINVILKHNNLRK